MNKQNYESKFYKANLCSSKKGWDNMQSLFQEADKELEAQNKVIAEYESGLSINAAIKVLEHFDMLEEADKLKELTKDNNHEY